MSYSDPSKSSDQPTPSLTLDRDLLSKTEDRFIALKLQIPNRLARTFSAFETEPASEDALSRGQIVKNLLRSNSKEALARRLKRIGVTRDLADQAADIAVSGSVALGAEFDDVDDATLRGLERLLGRNDLLGIQYLDGGLAASRSVARVVVRNATGRTLGYGTGSMVSPRLFLTNNHVFKSESAASNSLIEFNYQDDFRGQSHTPVRFRLEPAAFFTTSILGQLDFTLVAVAETAEDGTPLTQFGFNPLTVSEGEIVAGESVTIIQHPNGERKQIALRENIVLKEPASGDPFLHYQTDTTPGSSGSPVYNDQWELIALHHSGVPRKDANGNILSVDGQVWREEMGESRIDWIANEGIRARAILTHLKSLTGLTAAQKALLDPVLSRSGLETTLSLPVVTSNPPARDDEEANLRQREVNPPVIAGAVAQWTIPLQVSVTLGAPTLSGGGAAPTVTVTSNTSPQRPATAGPDRLDEQSLREARAEFERSATREYLDENVESTAKTAYYRGISNSSNTGDLFQALHSLLESSHANRPGYSPARRLYPWIDLQPDRRIRSIYSSQTFDPLELIEMDAEIDRARAERLEALRIVEASSDPMAYALEVSLIEANLPYNCEHVVPQSWFGRAEPMRGDLHHLFACETGCNSFRGNIPYFDFRGAEEVARADCGRREADRFEPSAGRGAVARATFYFLLRYPGAIRSGRSTYSADRLAMLLGWHRENPVSRYERHRNQAIFEVQGNRNPLIDHPEWADRIDFSVGLG